MPISLPPRGKRFFPESYGVIDGTPANDTTAIQAAINAASTAGGGVVVLTGTYNVTYKTGTIAHLGKYPTVDYALWVNHDDVFVIGEGHATLILTGIPSGATSDCFTMLLFGNGGSSDGSNVGASGTWTYRTGCFDVTFDCSACSSGNKTTLSSHIGSGALVFSYCWDFYAERNRFKSVYGYDGAITGNSSSRHGHIRDNEIYGTTKSGIWVDGGVDMHIVNNYLEAIGETGITLGSNLDNGIPALSNIVVGNIINGYAVTSGSGCGLSASGTDHVIANNRFEAPSTAGKGIQLVSYSTAVGKTPCQRCQVIGNRFYRNASGGTSYAIDITGTDSCVFDSTPLESADHHIVGNYISSNWTRGVNLGQQASRNQFSANHFESSNIAGDNATAVNNIWGANTYSDAVGNGKDVGLANSTLYFRPQNHIKLKGVSYYKLEWGTGLFLWAGSGSPEGAITGSPGARYLQVDGAAGAFWWDKISGTGNTGWQPSGPPALATSSRPASPVQRQTIFNTDHHRYEVYDTGEAAWTQIGEYAKPQTVTAGATLNSTFPALVLSATANRTLSTSTPITAGSFVGQTIRIINTSGFTISIPTGGNVNISTQLDLANGALTVFTWTGSVWQPGATNAEPPLGNPAADGYVLSSTTAGVRSWVASGGGGGGAPTTAQYLALAADSGLSAERVFTPGRGLEATDGGANSAYTLNNTQLRRNSYERFEDFDNTTSGTAFATVQSGTGAQVANNTADASHPGVASLQAGTTTTGRVAIVTSSTSLLLGGGAASFEALVQVSALSDATDTYIARIGFYDTTAGDTSDGVYFEYDQSTDTHWRICTSSSATRTKTNTTNTVPSATWQRLRIDVNPAGTSVDFFIDGVNVGTLTTNIPTGTGHELGVGAIILKSAGTTNRSFNLDYMWWRIILTTSR